MTKKQCILMASYAISKSNEELGQSIVTANRKLGEKLEDISNKEIKSKDRVDITLEEYENMKREISSLTSEVNWLRSILKRIEAPLDKNIIPDSIRTCYCDDHVNFRRVYRVEFALKEGFDG